MKRMKVRRQFARKRFYERVLADWKASVDDRKFGCVLSKALINLKAFPIEVIGIADLKNVKGIGDFIAQKLIAAWELFSSQSHTPPTFSDVEALRTGDFLQYLDGKKCSNKKRRVDADTASTELAEEAASSCSSEAISKRKKPVAAIKKRPNALMFAETEVPQVDEHPAASQSSNDQLVELIYHTPGSSNNSEVVLVVDNRERKKFELMAACFHKKNVNYEVRSLSIGDYLWILRPSNGTEIVLDHIVERKTFDDLRSSIIEKRYEEQKQRLMSAGLRNVIYILEGAKVMDRTLGQALVSTNLENGFLVHRTKNIEETAYFLAVITQRLLQRSKTEEIIGMSFDDFQRASKKTKSRTVKDVFTRQLVVCPQMTIKKASLLSNRFPSLSSLADFYATVPEENRETILAQTVNGIPQCVSAQMAKFFKEI